MVRLEPLRRSRGTTRTSGKKALQTRMPKRLGDITTTADIPIPERLIDQVIGQEHAVEIMRKAAEQRRHVLLIGEPGTGKSMLGLALAELLPREDLVDILVYPNPDDENEPIIKTVPACEGKEIVRKAKLEAMRQQGFNFQLIILAAALILPWWAFQYYTRLSQSMLVGAIMFATFFLAGMLMLMAFSVSQGMMQRQRKQLTPKLIVDNCGRDKAPFYDATGAHAGALLGDVLHDPFQTGGLGTPAHERVVAGMIHKAHKGVLFIDEIATLQPHTQQELLTALQEGKYPITGQSERSAGAIVRTQPVPCQFILVAAGNYENIQQMHPALRSRIRGYGYEVYMRETMPDTPENQWKLAVFVAQEVAKDGRIPHFTREAVEAIIEEARRRANRKGHLTLRLRELGGLVRAAGDLAREEGARLVEAVHVQRAKRLARPLEEQIADQYIEQKKEYEVIVTRGTRIGRVNGLAVIGRPAAWSGIILALEAEVTPSLSREGGRVHATGKLGEIAREAITNVTGLVKKLFGEDLKAYDIYLQFLQTHEGVEGDSASIAAAVAIISALKKLPVRQDVAMTGSLSVRGHVLPVGGVSAKVEAAVDAGLKAVIVPAQNVKDIILPRAKRRKIRIIPAETLGDVLREAFSWEDREAERDRILTLLEREKTV